MQTFSAERGLIPDFTAVNTVHRQTNSLWRPWTKGELDNVTYMTKSDELSNVKLPKTPQVTHPVKLYWPKSRCFDYLYQDAEMLLRNYPVQAAICLYEDSSSDEDDSEDEDEECDKDLN